MGDERDQVGHPFVRFPGNVREPHNDVPLNVQVIELGAVTQDADILQRGDPLADGAENPGV